MKLNIMGKIMAGIGVILLLMLGACLYLITHLITFDNDYTSLIDHDAAAYANSEATLVYYNAAVAYLRDYELTGNPAHINEFKQAISKAAVYQSKIQPEMDTAEEKQLYSDLKNKAAVLLQQCDEIMPLVQARDAAGGQERIAAEKQLLDFLESHRGAVTAVTDGGESLAKYELESLNTSHDKVLAQAAKTIRDSVIFVAVIILLGLVIGYFIARMIAVPIRLVDIEAAKIASGNLTGEKIIIRSKDESGRLAESFNIMLENLKDIVEQLQEKSQGVASSAAELSASAENVTAGATETASAITEVASTVEQVSQNTQYISDSSVQAGDLAREGSEGLQNVVSQMGQIQQMSTASIEIVRGLSEAAGRITQIVELITQIADQTNLLALNAAIEAARAGEHGHGFAVVAEEVRKLAEQSASASKEIHSLIANVQQESQKAVIGTEQNAIQVEAGAKVVQEVKGIFEKIITSVQGLAGEIQQIASSSGEINSAVQNIAASSEEQTAVMEEVASTSQILAGLSEELETLAARFKLM